MRKTITDTQEYQSALTELKASDDVRNTFDEAMKYLHQSNKHNHRYLGAFHFQETYAATYPIAAKTLMAIHWFQEMALYSKENHGFFANDEAQYNTTSHFLLHHQSGCLNKLKPDLLFVNPQTHKTLCEHMIELVQLYINRGLSSHTELLLTLNAMKTLLCDLKVLENSGVVKTLNEKMDTVFNSCVDLIRSSQQGLQQQSSLWQQRADSSSSNPQQKQREPFMP